MKQLTNYSITKLQSHYAARKMQFDALANAEYWFDKGFDTNMWQALIVYAEYMTIAKDLANSFTSDEHMILFNGRVPFYVLEMKEDDDSYIDNTPRT